MQWPFAKKSSRTVLLIGIDQDKDAIENAKNVLKPYLSNIRLFHGNFVHLSEFPFRVRHFKS